MRCWLRRSCLHRRGRGARDVAAHAEAAIALKVRSRSKIGRPESSTVTRSFVASIGHAMVTPLQVSRDAIAAATLFSGSSASACAISLHGLPSASAVRCPIAAANAGVVTAEALLGIHAPHEAQRRAALGGDDRAGAWRRRGIICGRGGRVRRGECGFSGRGARRILGGEDGVLASRASSRSACSAACSGRTSALSRASASIASSTVALPDPIFSSVNGPSALVAARTAVRDRIGLQRVRAERCQRRAGLEIAGRVEQAHLRR